jgi:hypothetical protein
VAALGSSCEGSPAAKNGEAIPAIKALRIFETYLLEPCNLVGDRRTLVVSHPLKGSFDLGI